MSCKVSTTDCLYKTSFSLIQMETKLLRGLSAVYKYKSSNIVNLTIFIIVCKGGICSHCLVLITDVTSIASCSMALWWQQHWYWRNYCQCKLSYQINTYFKIRQESRFTVDYQTFPMVIYNSVMIRNGSLVIVRIFSV